MWVFKAINYPLSSALAAFHKFCYGLLLFSLKYFLICIVIPSLTHVFRNVLISRYGPYWHMFPMHLKRMCSVVCLSSSLNVCWVQLFGGAVQSSLPSLIFCLLVLSVTEEQVSESLRMDLSLFSFGSIDFCLVYCEDLLLSAQSYRHYYVLLISWPCNDMKCLSLSLVFFLFLS